jgi:hypothetical protein
MENQSSTARLKEAIELLEAEKAVHLQSMRSNFFQAYESLKPANLFENTLKEVGSSPYIINNIFNIGFGLLAGFLSKKAMLIGKSGSKPAQLMGLILQLGVTSLVAYAPNALKSFAQRLATRKSEEVNTNV